MSEYATRLASGQDTAVRLRFTDALGMAPDGGLNSRSGIRPGGGGAVSVVAGGMTVQVTPFVAWIDGGTTDAQGGYTFVLDATKTLTIADGDPTKSRTDTIVARVRDTAYDGSGSTDASVVVIQGTPGSGAPVLPATCIPLRDVTVPAGLSAGTGGLTSSNLGTDRRKWTTAAGGIIPVAGTTERNAWANPYPGAAVYRLDTGRVEFYDGTKWADKEPRFGSYTGTTGANGSLVIPHSLGRTPGVVLVQDANSQHYAAPGPAAQYWTASQVTVFVRNLADGSVVTNAANETVIYYVL